MSSCRCLVFRAVCLHRIWVFLVCFCKVYYIHTLFPGVSISLCSVTLCSRLPGGEETCWEALMGKWASTLSPPLESSLKGLERWCRGLFPSPPPPPLMFFFLPQQQRRSPAAGAEPGFGQTHHAHQRNTRHWWLHWAEIRLPSIRNWKSLLWKIGFPRLGVFLPCCAHTLEGFQI